MHAAAAVHRIASSRLAACCLDVAEWEDGTQWRPAALHATITSEFRPPLRKRPASMRRDKPSIL